MTERTLAVAGNYRRRIYDSTRIDLEDLQNPWTFHWLFSQSDDVVRDWMFRKKLLPDTICCTRPGCGGIMTVSFRSNKPLGVSLRCHINRDHEASVMRDTFFERSKLDVRDIMAFIRSYLEGQSLFLSSKSAGISYGGTAVDWGSFIREIFKQHFHDSIRQKQLSGLAEIDESLFGRRVKDHRGDPNRGLKVWVFGLVDRQSNSVILYPVKNRSAATLVPLIQRHVKPGSKPETHQSNLINIHIFIEISI